MSNPGLGHFVWEERRRGNKEEGEEERMRGERRGGEIKCEDEEEKL